MARRDRADFYQRYGDIRNRPLHVDKPYTGTLLAKRNVRLALREGARRLSKVVILYTKITTGETKSYILEAYSFRYRHLKRGIRKMLFGYHWDPKKQKGSIKMFMLKNIHNVAVLPQKYKPRWVVEL